MNRLVSGAALVALTLLASLPALPASAAPVTLVAGDLDPLPGQAIPITGDGDDCPADSAGTAGTFLVSLTYTTVASTTATVTVAGAVSPEGTYSTSVTLPDTAVANVPASVIGTSTCGGVATESNRVNLAVLYHSGALTLSASTVAAGGRVTVTGTKCYGGEFLVLYGPEGGDPTSFDSGTSGVPAADRTFSSILTIPADQAEGAYEVFVRCPGTEFVARKLEITVAPAPTASASPGPTVTVPGSDPTFDVPDVTVSAPVTTTTLGGGFTGIVDRTAVSGGTTTGTTPVATAPVAVRGEAAFTG